MLAVGKEWENVKVFENVSKCVVRLKIVDVVRVVGVEVPRKRKMVRIWTIGHKD
jgi:hypothetical protein